MKLSRGRDEKNERITTDFLREGAVRGGVDVGRVGTKIQK